MFIVKNYNTNENWNFENSDEVLKFLNDQKDISHFDVKVARQTIKRHLTAFRFYEVYG